MSMNALQKNNTQCLIYKNGTKKKNVSVTVLIFSNKFFWIRGYLIKEQVSISSKSEVLIGERIE